MFNDAIKFLASLNWELIIAFVSLFISCFVLVSNHIREKERYEISVIDYVFRSPDILQLLVGITNKSSSPLIIVSVSCDGATCELEPKKIRGYPEKFGFVSTPRFPICVSSHGCQYAYLEFLNYQHTAPVRGTTLNLEIRSTLKTEQKTLLLGDISHYLHTREQLRAYRDAQEKN